MCCRSVVAPGDPLQPGGRAGERAVGRLGDGHVLVLALLQQVHQAQAVLRQQDAVGVQRHDVVGVGDAQVALAGAAAHQRRAGRRRRLGEAAAHQPQVAVQVHCLIGLVRQRHVALALEAGHLGPERPDQAPVEAPDLRAAQDGALLGRLAQRGRDGPQRVRQRRDHLIGEEVVGVVLAGLLGGQHVEPGDGRVVVAGQDEHLLHADRAAAPAARLELVQGGDEHPGRAGQQLIDLPGQRARRQQQLTGPRVLRPHRVVDQQHDPLARELLQRRRQQRLADDRGVLLVGGNDRGQRGRGGVVELVQDRPAGPVVAAGPVEETQPAQQVGQRRRRQHRHDEQVGDRLGAGDRGGVDRVEQVAQQPGEEVAQPRRHRDDDGQPGQRDAPVTDGLGHHRQRVGAPVPAPLPPLAAGWPGWPRRAARAARRRARATGRRARLGRGGPGRAGGCGGGHEPSTLLY